MHRPRMRTDLRGAGSHGCIAMCGHRELTLCSD
jgi:hypothetical protein